ncbi:hypothetical protein ACVWY2_003624 [Bradyrhizobium sp. JR6.1]
MNEQVQPASGEPLFNPLAPEFIRNPYPYYERLRRLDPMHVNVHGAFVASRHAEASLVLRDKRFGKDYVERSIRRYGPKIMEEPVIRSMSHWMLQQDPPDHTPPARPRRQGVHRAPGRGHAPADSVRRRRNARPHHSARKDGPDRGFRIPPAGDDHLRHARHPRGASRCLLQRLARRRPPARAGAADGGGDQAGQRRQRDGRDVFPPAVRAAPQTARRRPHHTIGAGRGERPEADQRGTDRQHHPAVRRRP